MPNKGKDGVSMKKIQEMLEALGLKVTSVKEVQPYMVKVSFIEGYNNFFTKFFFTGPKGNPVGKHDGKFVLAVTPISEGYYTGKLLEKDSYFLFKPLPVEIDIDGKVYKLEYRKDAWGF
mgnify:CR=1 FL=1